MPPIAAYLTSSLFTFLSSLFTSQEAILCPTPPTSPRWRHGTPPSTCCTCSLTTAAIRPGGGCGRLPRQRLSAALREKGVIQRLSQDLGGGPYPAGRPEFNVQQDPIACRVLLDSAVTVWQIPQDVYARFEVSLSELALRVRPCGEVGAYLFRQLMDEYPSEYDPRFPLRTGGNWTLGDNTTAAVLLENGFRGHWTLRPAPVLLPSLTYAEASDRKTIRVYHDLDVRFALEDFYSKLALCYPR